MENGKIKFKILSVLSAVIVGICGMISSYGIISAASEQNLIEDGSFENLDKTLGFNTVEGEPYGTSTTTQSISISENWASDGEKSVAVVAGVSNNNPAMNYVVAAQNGKTYRATADIHVSDTSSLSGTAYMRICPEKPSNTIQSSQYGSSWGTRGTVSDIQKAYDSYMTVSAVFTAQQDYTTVRLNVGMFVDSSMSVVQYIDNLRWEEVLQTESTPTPTPSATAVPSPTPSAAAVPSPTPAPSATAPASVSLLADGSFENITKTTLGTATVENEPFGSSGTVKSIGISTDWASDGEKSVAIVASITNNNAAMNYLTTAQNGKTYKATADIHVSDTSSLSGTAYMRICPEQPSNSVQTSQYMDSWGTRGTVSDIQKAHDSYVTVSAIFTAQQDYTRIRLNVGIFVDSGTSTVQYVDNLKWVEMGDTPSLSSVEIQNSEGENDGLPLVPTQAKMKLTFNGAIKASSITEDSLLLNGKEIDTEDIDITANDTEIYITLKNLRYGKVYKLSSKDGAWEDFFDRTLAQTELKFKTVSRVAIGDVSMYNGSEKATALSDGSYGAKVEKIENLTDSEQSVSLIVVLYKDGKIADRGVKSVTLGAAETLDELTSDTPMELRETTNGNYSLSCFVWDSAEGGLSLYKAITLK